MPEKETENRKISRSEFSEAVKVAEENVTKELNKLKKSLDKKKITRKDYADKRMIAFRNFIEVRRKLQEMISDDVNSQQDNLDNDDDEAISSNKVVNVEEENTIKDGV